MKSPFTIFIASLIFLAGFNALADGKVYKWTDDSGLTHYTRYKPTTHKWQEVDAPPPPPSVSYDLNKDAAEQIRGAAEKKKKADSTATAQTDDADFKEQQCKTAKANMDTLKTGARVRYTDEEGNQVPMPEEQRASRLQEAQKNIDFYCK